MAGYLRMLRFIKTPAYTPHYAEFFASGRYYLVALIEAIRKGHTPDVAPALLKYLHRFSLLRTPDVMYGLEIPFEVRQRWRQVAQDLESANEVIEYLLRQGTDPVFRLDWAGEYGQEIPFSLRQKWRQMGMDPESDNEVQEFNLRQGHTDGLDEFGNRMKP